MRPTWMWGLPNMNRKSWALDNGVLIIRRIFKLTRQHNPTKFFRLTAMSRWFKYNSISETNSGSIISVLNWLNTYSALLLCWHKLGVTVDLEPVRFVSWFLRLLCLAFILLGWILDLFEHRPWYWRCSWILRHRRIWNTWHSWQL